MKKETLKKIETFGIVLFLFAIVGYLGIRRGENPNFFTAVFWIAILISMILLVIFRTETYKNKLISKEKIRIKERQHKQWRIMLYIFIALLLIGGVIYFLK